MSPRLAPVPPPEGKRAVSPWRTCTSDGLTPRASATIWANVVSEPWPCGETPVEAVTYPDGAMRTWALSTR